MFCPDRRHVFYFLMPIDAYCTTLASFAKPGQSPTEFAKTYADAEKARLTLHETEGFNRLDIRVKKGLEVTRAAIEFGVLAHLCASKYGDGAPITCNNETKALAKSLFGTGGIPGVRAFYSTSGRCS